MVSVWLELVDSLGLWLSDDLTLSDLFLSASSSDSDSVDDVALLGSVSQASGLLDSGWSGASVDDRELSVLPGSHSEDEAHNVGLLLSPKLVQVSVCSHFGLQITVFMDIKEKFNWS